MTYALAASNVSESTSRKDRMGAGRETDIPSIRPQTNLIQRPELQNANSQHLHPQASKIAYSQPTKPNQAPQRFTLTDRGDGKNGYEKKPTGRFQWVEIDGAIKWAVSTRTTRKAH